MIEREKNDSLVNYLIATEYLYTKDCIDAFSQIDRADFITDESKDFAYINSPLSIGHSQTISQPIVVAFMMELLSIKKGNTVLDIGSGSGYTTALLSKMTGEDGKVLGVERVPELVDFGSDNLKKYDISNAKIILASNKLGCEGETFDKILVSASASEFPKELLTQLRSGGRLVMPIRNSIFLIEKKEDEIKTKEYTGFSFVPLIYD